MKISQHSLLLVFTSIVSGLLIASLLMYKYLQVDKQVQLVQSLSLAENDTRHMQLMLSQWMTTIDLLLANDMSYLADGITRQSAQIQSALGMVGDLSGKTNSRVLVASMQTELQRVDGLINQVAFSDQPHNAASIWLSRIDRSSEKLIEDYESLQGVISSQKTVSSQRYERYQNELHISAAILLSIYLIVNIVCGLWNSRKLVRPLEELRRKALAGFQGRSQNGEFNLQAAPFEIMQLSKSIDKYLNKLEGDKQNLSVLLEKLSSTQTQLVESEKLASIGRLAAGLAHEMNNPLAVVLSNTCYLKEQLSLLIQSMSKVHSMKQRFDGLADKANFVERRSITFIDQCLSDIDIDEMVTLPEIAQETDDSLHRVVDVVAKMRIFSEIDKGTTQRGDLKSIINSVVGEFSQMKPDLNFLLAIDQPFWVQCHIAQLSMAIHQLVKNAVEASPRDKDISIRVQPTTIGSNKVQLVIEDFGCGIDTANMSKIYDPFFTTKDVGHGAGLGLHLARTIIHNQGALLEIDSRLDRGTRAVIIFEQHPLKLVS